MSNMFFYSRPPAGSAVRVHPLLTLSSLLLLSLPTANAACTTDPNDTAAEPCPRSTPQLKSELPSIIIFCIVTSAVFFIVIGSFLIYFYVRQMRERTKRNEHRDKGWQYRDMKQNGQRLNLKADGKGGGAPIQISQPVLMSEATTSPRYPDKTFYW